MLSRLHLPVAEQAGAGQMASSTCLPVCQEMLMLCGSGDGYLSSTKREPSRKLERDFLQGHVVVGKGEMALD